MLYVNYTSVKNLKYLNNYISKNICSVRDTIKKMKGTDREKVFSKDIYHKGLLSKVHKGHFKLNNKKMNNSKNGQKTWADSHQKIYIDSK